MNTTSGRMHWMLIPLLPALNVLAFRSDAAQESKPPPAQAAGTVRDAKAVEETDAPNPETARLEVLIGPWRITETHFNSRGERIGQVDGTEEVTWLLDKHAIQRVYQTFSDTSSYHALGLLAYSVTNQEYRGVWMDNTTLNGPTQVSGLWSPESRSFIFELERTESDGARRRYRKIEELTDEQHRMATLYRVDGAEVTKILEVAYQRMVPCPDKVRPVFGELLRQGR